MRLEVDRYLKMSAESKTPILSVLSKFLPSEIATRLRELCESSSTTQLLDTLIGFTCGASCPPHLSSETRDQWTDRQTKARAALEEILRPDQDTKRPREDDTESYSRNKRPKTSDDESLPIFTLHSISVTSPVRKKVDMIVSKTSLKFTNPTTKALESTVSLSLLRRAFILPTRGKQKPHWTVVILSSDTPDRGKPTAVSASQTPQIIFGLEALAASPVTATSYSSQTPEVHTVPKGGKTLPSIRDFLSHLGEGRNIPILEPTPSVFKSACANTGASAIEGGVPGIEAYRAAKPGSLWFMKEGILWGESKPCEFWAVEDLIGKSEGLRIISATGRTCTIILTRRGEDEDEEGEDMGEETAFSLVDGKEQDGISQWTREYRHLFGKQEGQALEKDKGKGKEKEKESGGVGSSNGMTIYQVAGDSDDSDEDFEADEKDGSGSASSSNSSSDEEAVDDGEGSEQDAEGSDEDAESEEVADEGLDPEHHPLMRPGAMPKMSRAAIDMVVGMVEDDMMGVTNDSEEEADELED